VALLVVDAGEGEAGAVEDPAQLGDRIVDPNVGVAPVSAATVMGRPGGKP
jgi:hypothetical protein